MDITRRQVGKYDVYILWGQRPLTPDHVEDLFDPRVHLIKVDAIKGAMGTVVNPKAYMAVRRHFNEIKPDIVHLHSSASGFVGRWALPLSGVKAFYTPHGYSFLMQSGLPMSGLRAAYQRKRDGVKCRVERCMGVYKPYTIDHTLSP